VPEGTGIALKRASVRRAAMSDGLSAGENFDPWPSRPVRCRLFVRRCGRNASLTAASTVGVLSRAFSPPAASQQLCQAASDPSWVAADLPFHPMVSSTVASMMDGAPAGVALWCRPVSSGRPR
jgi:hypothetical protein